MSASDFIKAKWATLKPKIKPAIKYGLTALEEKTGILSTARMIALPLTYIIVVPTVLLQLDFCLHAHAWVAMDKAFAWWSSSIVLGVNGAKCAQAFTEIP